MRQQSGNRDTEAKGLRRKKDIAIQRLWVGGWQAGTARTAPQLRRGFEVRGCQGEKASRL